MFHAEFAESAPTRSSECYVETRRTAQPSLPLRANQLHLAPAKTQTKPLPQIKTQTAPPAYSQSAPAFSHHHQPASAVSTTRKQSPPTATSAAHAHHVHRRQATSSATHRASAPHHATAQSCDRPRSNPAPHPSQPAPAYPATALLQSPPHHHFEGEEREESRRPAGTSQD